MCDLPTRRSVGCIYIADYYPDEKEAAISLPQQYYISTMTCWTDAADDARMRKWMYDQYAALSPAGVGQYIADFDVTHRLEKVSLAFVGHLIRTLPHFVCQLTDALFTRR